MSNAEKNWRPQTTGADYFQQAEKRLQFEERRPRINRPADLVGPGIDAYARALDDLDDALATFNGYYSALGTAANNPAGVPLIGMVTNDVDLGGMQVFWPVGFSYGTGTRYERVFYRGGDDSSVTIFGSWVTIAPYIPNDSGWQTLALATDSLPVTGETPKFRRSNNVLYFQGKAKPSSGPTYGTDTSWLISGPGAIYQPLVPVERILAGNTADAYVRATIDPTDGTILIYTNPGVGPSAVDLSGLSGIPLD